MAVRHGIVAADRVIVLPCQFSLPRSVAFPYLREMEGHFTPEQEAQQVKNAALRLLQEEARFRAAVREGIAQADRGEFIEEEEMDARLEEMLRS